MNLIIDQGNTQFKVGLFNENEFVNKAIFQYSEISTFKSWLNKNSFNFLNVIICSVVDQKIDLSEYNIHSKVELKHTTRLPIANKYQTPKTLGNDRLANAVAAWCLKPNSNCLIIDLGTCVKYDLLSKNGEYLGGNISPGLKMRFKALNHFTDQLPLIEKRELHQNFGSNTESSIQCGVQLGLENEILGFINRYSKMYSDLTIFMTGGDLKSFDKSFKNHIFANSNLTLIGLNEILNHNAKL